MQHGEESRPNTTPFGSNLKKVWKSSSMPNLTDIEEVDSATESFAEFESLVSNKAAVAEAMETDANDSRNDQNSAFDLSTIMEATFEVDPSMVICELCHELCDPSAIFGSLLDVQFCNACYIERNIYIPSEATTAYANYMSTKGRRICSVCNKKSPTFILPCEICAKDFSMKAIFHQGFACKKRVTCVPCFVASYD